MTVLPVTTIFSAGRFSRISGVGARALGRRKQAIGETVELRRFFAGRRRFSVRNPASDMAEMRQPA